MSKLIQIHNLEITEKQQSVMNLLKNKYLTYDIETYPNIFTLVIQNMHRPEIVRLYEISEWVNDAVGLKNLLNYLSENDKVRMVGFNNWGFDWEVMDYFMTKINPNMDGATIAKMLWFKAGEIINRTHDERFEHTIWPQKMLIKQLDLYKMNHFDNAAKRTSLKALEYYLELDNIQDLPFPPNTVLTEQDAPILRFYNEHDVFATSKVFLTCLQAIKAREDISREQNRYADNDPDMKIGTMLYIKELEKRLGDDICYYKDSRGQRVTRQTIRKQIVAADIIFDIYDFKRPETRCVHQFFKSQIIKDTKGGFTKLPYTKFIEDSEITIAGKEVVRRGRTIKTADRVVNITDYMDQEEITKKLAKQSPEKVLISKIHVVIDGLQYDFGTGGIHAAVNNEAIIVPEGYKMGEADVGSMYPSIAVEYGLFPAHLGPEFVEILADFKAKRMQYKADSSNMELRESLRDAAKALSDQIKLAMNAGAFGATNNEHSPFYDSQMTMTITINGQLMLLLLVERLLEIEGLRVVQANTDGVVAIYKEEHTDQYNAILEQWEKDTLLSLEYQPYIKLFSRDVNNYLAVTDKGKVKRKGAYMTSVQMHQDKSAMVIPKAVEAVLLQGVDLMTFLRSHDHNHDFTLRQKTPRSGKTLLLTDVIGQFDKKDLPPKYDKITPQLRYKLENTDPEEMKEILLATIGKNGKLTRKNMDLFTMLTFGMPFPKTVTTKQEQNFSRYMMMKDGEYMFKVLPEMEGSEKVTGDRYFAVKAGHTVKMCNNMKDFDRNLVDYDWYASEALKLIDPVRPT